MKKKTMVLLIGHGTVDDLADLPAFLKNVRRGREAPPELVAELRHRYEAIGGKSPLDEISARVAKKLEGVLGVPVRAASRLWKPYTKDVVDPSVERLVVIPLAQHSADVYAEVVRREVDAEVVAATNWGSDPALLDAFAKRARAVASEDAALVLTAHSLPKSVIAAGDAYEREVRAAAAGVIERVSSEFAETRVVFQSQGPGSDSSEWLGPTFTEAFDEIAKRRRRVVVAPIGFLADHVEILYDIDIEAKTLAEARGLALSRTESLNDADDFIAVLAGIARRLLA